MPLLKAQAIPALSVLLLFLFPAAFLPAQNPAKTAASSSSCGQSEYGDRPGPKGFKTVIIDAGHGGHDSGARSSFTQASEKDLALDTARRLAKILEKDFKVVLLRNSDVFVDLDDRVAFANRYNDAILLSIHYNSSSPHLRGPETYYWRVDSHGLATRVQRALVKAASGEGNSRGLVRRRLRLTRNPRIPSVLAEAGYLSNPAESRKIAGASYRQAVAAALAEAIRTQAAIGDEGTGPLPKAIYAPPSRPTDPPD